MPLPGRRQLTVALALALAGAGCGDGPRERGPLAGPGVPPDARTARVERVVDGDTIDLSGLGTSRLIGIDTPEVGDCFGRDASEFADRELAGEQVRWSFGRERRDRFGRALVYVWLADGRSFNALALARGYAVPLTIPPNDEYAPLFARLARRARTAGAGLWGRGAC